ncbi:hypothetical protein GCM10011581_48530 [Saccharopolyspora subtropica]|uniref:Uncharacterized protein n=1 Tax=Saccharopolyspora thermophila TaxID=89367 RepID=A0A917NJE9_9PSEU|nr:hypothetical protein [Saccharopolyspora subtropica]GGJ05748.1 hypothetical protein GCM10011581_48530 [Saccharopolyspora subtropica]
MNTTTGCAHYARCVVSASQKLMDGLLEAEGTRFARLDAELQHGADATCERIVAAARLSWSRLLRGERLPEDRWLGWLAGGYPRSPGCSR